MIIRKAYPEDADCIPKFLLMAMEDIFSKFVNNISTDEQENILRRFVRQKNNLYSYENCIITVVGNEIIAVANVYDGNNAPQLRKPFIEYVKENFNNSFNPEEETEEGEFYIDTISVSPEYRGLNVGERLIKFIINEYALNRKGVIGLLVENDNFRAEKLYRKVGFEFIGNKKLMGKTLKHFQFRI